MTIRHTVCVSTFLACQPIFYFGHHYVPYSHCLFYQSALFTVHIWLDKTFPTGHCLFLKHVVVSALFPVPYSHSDGWGDCVMHILFHWLPVIVLEPEYAICIVVTLKQPRVANRLQAGPLCGPGCSASCVGELMMLFRLI